jgi:hypothetical protein
VIKTIKCRLGRLCHTREITQDWRAIWDGNSLPLPFVGDVNDFKAPEHQVVTTGVVLLVLQKRNDPASNVTAEGVRPNLTRPISNTVGFASIDFRP